MNQLALDIFAVSVMLNLKLQSDLESICLPMSINVMLSSPSYKMFNMFY